MLRHVLIDTDPESLGDISPESYHDMLEALIAEHFGADETGYTFAFRIAAPSCVRVTADGENDGQDRAAEETIRRLCETAFARCCNGDPLPLV